jgi:hypothetical protein
MKSFLRILSLSTLLALFAFAAAPVSSSALAADTTEGFPLGTSLTFEATSDGIPAPTFEWFKDGVKVADGASFTIPSLSAANVGRYTVTATNAAGSTASVDGYVLQLFTAPSAPTIKVTAKKPTDVTVSVPKGTRVVVQ